MILRAKHLGIAFACISAFTLAACKEQSEVATNEVLTKDPLLARALHDPLMVDPDLAWRNEANAVIAYRDGHPLPPFLGRPDAAERARQAADAELLIDGPIPDMPLASGGEGAPALGNLKYAGEMMKAVGAREDCIAALTDRLSWSTQMPPTSSVMPHGMIQQAAGVDEGTCVARVVRYITPASVQDAIEYHFAKVERARFRIERFDVPELQIRAERRDQVIAVHSRAGANDMTEVDIVHWRK